ncbi:MAG: ParB/RepB/Spo0J family partition protein [Frankiaceae bacterium]|nr:ParB/RepB/Spo0J family partition protein [Frankiaceae bacterium]
MSTPRHGGLGRGLGALIPQAADGDQAVEGARFAEVPVERIAPNPAQPRTHFDDEALRELVDSIREVGLLQPIVVRPTGPQSYELVMGERRLRAAKEAGLERIPAIVRDTGDEVMLRDALLENLHRQQLNPLEEAAAYSQLLQDFGATHEELATRIGRSRSTITNMIRLLQLPSGVQRRVAAGVLSAGHARAILGLASPEAQERMAERVVAEGLSVRGVEEAVAMAGGDDDAPARKKRSRGESPAEFGVVADRLAERFETRVRVDASGKGRGKVIIEFAGLEDLQRIVDVIDGPTSS